MSEELIKRKAVIATIEAMFRYCTTYDLIEYKELMLEAVKALPSADRPQGKWIAVSSYDAFGGSEGLWNAHGNPTAFHYCSKCKAQSYVNEFGEELLTDFCPNCGARMKGADDE